MAKIRLYGHLQRFGSEFNLSVKTPSEAIRALLIQLKGFRTELAKGHYTVKIDDEPIQECEFKTRAFLPLGDDATLHIVPLVGAAKSSWGILGAIAGIVMIGVGIVSWNPALIAGGVGMVAGSAAMLAMPKQAKIEEVDNGPANKYFQAMSNEVAQGSCVPLIYGKVLVGSKVLSHGLNISAS